ncbi:glycosyltransferase family 4 protein [Halovulum sp. GXIMD14794]
MTTIVHLIDDTTAGGVMRVLEHLETDPTLGAFATHRIQTVERGRFGAPAVEGADVIVSHLSVSWRALPMLVALRARYAHLPVIHVEHSYTEAFTALNVSRRGRFMALLRIAYSLFDKVVAVSEAQGAWLVERGLVAAPALRVIPSAVDVTPFAELRPVYTQPRTFGAIGRLDAQKGFDRLIDAFRATDREDLHLRIIGDGPEREALEARADGDSRISFTGFVFDAASAMDELDAVAMPSRWEAYGLVALEARAAGRPLLVSPVDGLEDHVAAGATVVEGDSVADWTRAITRLADSGPALHIAVARARKDAMQATERFAGAWAALVGELVATDGKTRSASDAA